MIGMSRTIAARLGLTHDAVRATIYCHFTI